MIRTNIFESDLTRVVANVSIFHLIAVGRSDGSLLCAVQVCRRPSVKRLRTIDVQGGIKAMLSKKNLNVKRVKGVDGQDQAGNL